MNHIVTNRTMSTPSSPALRYTVGPSSSLPPDISANFVTNTTFTSTLQHLRYFIGTISTTGDGDQLLRQKDAPAGGTEASLFDNLRKLMATSHQKPRFVTCIVSHPHAQCIFVTMGKSTVDPLRTNCLLELRPIEVAVEKPYRYARRQYLSTTM